MMKFPIAGLLLATTVSLARAEAIPLDLAHSAITFSVPHMVVSRTKGAFNDFNGSLTIEDGKLVGASAVIQVKSIDTRNTRRDDHLRSVDFFDVEQFPTITFESTRVEEGKLIGNLTIKGITREVTLDMEFLGPVQGFQGKTLYGLNATTTIDRRDFGLTWSRVTEAGGLVVGNEVQIAISVEVAK